MSLPTPSPDSALSRGVRTFAQAVIGFVVGLFLVIWYVPGVPDAVVAYLGQHWLDLAVQLGIPTGIASYVWNLLRHDVANY